MKNAKINHGLIKKAIPPSLHPLQNRGFFLSKNQNTLIQIIHLIGMNNKKAHGQFFTIKNPFELKSFKEVFDNIPKKNSIFLEPFAGSKNIPSMFDKKYKWAYYDIDPKEPDIILNDSLKNFPKGYEICITNPPYLSKNSATRSKIAFPDTVYDDLYKIALEQMINNCRYTIAIIPESFITSGLFLKNIVRIISIDFELFDDTECPVCVAIFDNKKTEINFDFYRGEKFLISYKNLSKQIYKSRKIFKKYNFYNPKGFIGLIAIDNTKEDSIKFCVGDEIDSSNVKKTSRSLTRISLDPDVEKAIVEYGLNKFIDSCNAEIIKMRKNTHDLYLTAFKGLRKDGKYRRRLSFDLAKIIIENVYYSKILKKTI